jgi:hypothetical protein
VWHLERVEGRSCAPLCGLVGRQFGRQRSGAVRPLLAQLAMTGVCRTTLRLLLSYPLEHRLAPRHFADLKGAGGGFELSERPA